MHRSVNILAYRPQSCLSRNPSLWASTSRDVSIAHIALCVLLGALLFLFLVAFLRLQIREVQNGIKELNAQLTVVAGDIKAVGEKIDNTESEIRVAEEKSDKDRVMRWTKAQEHLWKEKEQLRKEKEQLASRLAAKEEELRQLRPRHSGMYTLHHTTCIALMSSQQHHSISTRAHITLTRSTRFDACSIIPCWVSPQG